MKINHMIVRSFFVADSNDYRNCIVQAQGDLAPWHEQRSQDGVTQKRRKSSTMISIKDMLLV